MKDIIILGAGGFGKEVAQLIEDINKNKKSWNLLGYIDETPEKLNTTINNHKVLGDLSWFEKNKSGKLFVVVAIGKPKDKYSLIKRTELINLNYANLIHPSAKISKYVTLGEGCIICCNCVISVNTKLGSYVSINPNCGVGHDSVIDSYSTLYWNVTLSGNAHIKEGCEIGSSADVIPRKTVGSWSVIGAGAVITHDIPDNCTAVGIPAKPIKFHPKN